VSAANANIQWFCLLNPDSTLENSLLKAVASERSRRILLLLLLSFTVQKGKGGTSMRDENIDLLYDQKLRWVHVLLSVKCCCYL